MSDLLTQNVCSIKSLEKLFSMKPVLVLGKYIANSKENN